MSSYLVFFLWKNVRETDSTHGTQAKRFAAIVSVSISWSIPQFIGIKICSALIIGIRCHYTQQYKIFLEDNICGLNISSHLFTSWLIAPLISLYIKNKSNSLEKLPILTL